jgi:CRISPR-associated endonuclease/helicase Cas3
LEINKHKQALCIVSTRKHAKEIFDKLEGDAFHLSTLMCSVHRQKVLKEIKDRLRNNQLCKVVSTQLIEAE